MLFYQDVNECTGPQSKLTELNSKVKERFHNLRLRIQVGASGKHSRKCAATAPTPALLCIFLDFFLHFSFAHRIWS